MQPTTLFNQSSISNISLVNFTIDTQVTVAALGLPTGAVVTFEMVQISSPVREAICPGSCEIPAVQLPSETAWQPLLCCDGTPIRVNAANPYVILDAPQHVRLRALVTGYDLSAAPFSGEVIVYPSKSESIGDDKRGCCADPDVKATVSLCPVPNCFTWRGAKYLNLADFVADVQTIIAGATYDAATCTFSAPVGSTFPDLTIVACVPCPPLTITAVPSGTTSATVTITGGPATVTLNGESQYGSGPFTFTGLTAGKTYTAFAISDCGEGTIKGSTSVTVQACPAVDFTALALSTTSVQVTATASAPLTISVVDQSGNVLDSVDGVSSTLIFADLPDGAIVTVKAVNECGKTKQLNVKLPATPVVVSPCPSFSLSDTSPAFKGFAYVAGDEMDAAATVPFRGGFIYPTAGVGHTVKVTDALGAVIGYAANKSDCANPCCNQVSNRVSVDGGIIDDSTDTYYVLGELKACDDTNILPTDRLLKVGSIKNYDGTPIACGGNIAVPPAPTHISVDGGIINDATDQYYIEGEVNKCDGTPVLPDDRLFNKGSLKTCVNGQIVDLDCNMIVKTIPDCAATDCEINTLITQDSQLSGGGVCIPIGVSSYGASGQAIARMRDFVDIQGNIDFTGSNPPTHLPFSYTNNTGCPVLVEAILTGHTNGVALGGSGTLGAAYHVGENLNYDLPNSFSTFYNGTDPQTMRHTFAIKAPTGSGAGAVYHEETVSGARFRKIVPDGVSLAIFAQAWIMAFQSDPISNGTVIHTNMQLDIKVTKGAAYL